ncbi:MAG: hypothetical protein ACK502_02915 [Alphaproteobacteria bacterium]
MIGDIITTGEISKTIDRRHLIFTYRLTKAIGAQEHIINLEAIATDEWTGFLWDTVCRYDDYEYVGDPDPDILVGWYLRFSQKGRDAGATYNFKATDYGDGMRPNNPDREWCVMRSHAILYKQSFGWVLMDKRNIPRGQEK